MPQINDYAVSETSAAEPVGGLQPDLASAGEPGRGVENVGQALMGVGEVIQRRETMKEQAQVFATNEKNRAEWTTNLQVAQTDPDFDADKFIQTFDDQTDQMQENVNTSGGKDYFTRQRSRLRASLLGTAMKYQADQAGREAKALIQSGLNDAANTSLNNNPEMFADVLHSNLEGLHEMALANPKIAGAVPDLQAHIGSTLAMGAIRGYANQDPGSIEDGREGAGQKALHSGVFDSFLTTDQKQRMETELHARARANDADTARQQRSVADLQADYLENWKQNLVQPLLNNKLTAKDVMNATLEDGSPVPFKEKMHMVQMIREQAHEKIQGNAQTFSAMIGAINADPQDPMRIQSTSQIWSQVGKGLTIQQASQLTRVFNQNQQNKDVGQQEKNLIKLAATLKKSNGTGYDPTSVEKYGQFYSDLQAAKAQRLQQGLPVSDLFDPSNKDYFGSKIQDQKYQTSTTEILNNTMRSIQGPTPKALQRKDGESPADYLKRVKSK